MYHIIVMRLLRRYEKKNYVYYGAVYYGAVLTHLDPLELGRRVESRTGS